MEVWIPIEEDRRGYQRSIISDTATLFSCSQCLRLYEMANLVNSKWCSTELTWNWWKADQYGHPHVLQDQRRENLISRKLAEHLPWTLLIPPRLNGLHRLCLSCIKTSNPSSMWIVDHLTQQGSEARNQYWASKNVTTCCWNDDFLDLGTVTASMTNSKMQKKNAKRQDSWFLKDFTTCGPCYSDWKAIQGRFKERWTA